MKHLFIITGASRGLGRGLAEIAARAGNEVITFSRTKIADGLGIKNLQIDLADTEVVLEIVESTFKDVNLNDFSGVHLVNNAGVVEPIGLSENCSPDEVIKNISINFSSPVVLTNLFLKLTKSFSGQRSVTLVSSGVARSPKPYWSIYSAVKSGLRTYGVAVAGEYESQNLKVINFEPGIMDTEMQAGIRKQPAQIFPDVQRFKDFKNEGALLKPEVVGRVLFDLIMDPQKLPKTDVSVYDYRK